MFDFETVTLRGCSLSILVWMALFRYIDYNNMAIHSSWSSLGTGNVSIWETVTEQTGARPWGTFTYDPIFSVEGNRFLLTGFQPQVRGVRPESTAAQSTPLPRDPEPPLLHKRLQARTMPRRSPAPYLFLSWSHKQVSILSRRCPCGFQSRHPLAAALLQDLGCAVLSLHAVSGSGKHMLCYTGSWCSPGRHTSQKSAFSVHPSEKQKYLLFHSRQHGFWPFSFSLPSLKFSALELPPWSYIWPFLWYVCVHHFCQFPSIFYLLLAGISSQRRPGQKFPAMHGHPGCISVLCLSCRWNIRSPTPGYVTSPCNSPLHPHYVRSPWLFSQSCTQFTLGHNPLPFRKASLLTCHCYATYLKGCIIYFPLPLI